MAKNTGNGGRKGQVTNRYQEQKGDTWVKRERDTGRVVGVKEGDPYKGVTKK